MVASTVLFVDLDGTICVNPFRTAVFPHIHRLLSPETALSGDQLIQLFVGEFVARLNASDGHTPQAADWDEIVIQVVGRLGVHLNVSVRELVEQHAHPPYISMLDEADVTLAHLRRDARRRLVVSSMGLAKFQMPVLRGLGLTQIFHDYLMPDLTGHLKDRPEFYAKYTAALPPDTLFISIGDTYKDDVQMPKQCGFRAIMKVPLPELRRFDPLERPAVLSNYRAQIPSLPEVVPVLPDAVITHISELPDVVERLERLERLEKQTA